MEDWIDLVTENLWSTILLLFLVLGVAGKLIERAPSFRPWGERVAQATFLIVTGAVCWTTQSYSVTDLLYAGFVGTLVGGLACGVTWIVLPIVFGIWSATGGAALSWARRSSATLRHRAASLRLQQQQEKDRQLLEQEQARLAPELNRKRAEAAERARQEAIANAASQRRRDEARMRAELMYERHARQLGSFFPRERLEQFFQKYMNDSQSPDSVEQREQLLKEMIVESLGAATSSVPRFSSLSELAEFFADRRKDIEALPHDESIKDSYRVQLNKQEDEALRRFLKP